MRPSRPPGNQCPRDERDEPCNLACKYNFFEAGDLTIHSWELKCLDCGHRQTIGYRSDDDEGEVPDCPSRCPFCERTGLVSGRNPCDA